MSSNWDHRGHTDVEFFLIKARGRQTISFWTSCHSNHIDSLRNRIYQFVMKTKLRVSHLESSRPKSSSWNLHTFRESWAQYSFARLLESCPWVAIFHVRCLSWLSLNNSSMLIWYKWYLSQYQCISLILNIRLLLCCDRAIDKAGAHLAIMRLLIWGKLVEVSMFHDDTLCFMNQTSDKRVKGMKYPWLIIHSCLWST